MFENVCTLLDRSDLQPPTNVWTQQYTEHQTRLRIIGHVGTEAQVQVVASCLAGYKLHDSR